MEQEHQQSQQAQQQQTNKEKGFLVQEMQDAVSEVKSTFATSTTFIISALSFVAALAWRDVANALFEHLKEKISGWGETIGLLIYAILVTLIAVFVVRRLKKIQKRVGGKSIK